MRIEELLTAKDAKTAAKDTKNSGAVCEASPSMAVVA
jgi:hypothetical protein